MSENGSLTMLWPYFSVPRPQKHCLTTSETLYWLTVCIETILAINHCISTTICNSALFAKIFPKLMSRKSLKTRKSLRIQSNRLFSFWDESANLWSVFPPEDLLKQFNYFSVITVSYSFIELNITEHVLNVLKHLPPPPKSKISKSQKFQNMFGYI